MDGGQWEGAVSERQPVCGRGRVTRAICAEMSSNTKDGNWLWISAMPRCCSLPRAAVTDDHMLVAENNRNVLSHSSGG